MFSAMKLRFILVLLFSAMLSAFATGAERHVVVVVFDGLRPDSVSPETTPALHRLAKEGVFFANHHAVYPSTTEVNGTAMATGGQPRSSGIIANREYRPRIDPLAPVPTEDLLAVRKGDELSGNRYIGLPTVAEILRGKGLRTALAGTKPVILLQDRFERGPEADPVVFAGRCLPATAINGIAPLLGLFPTKKVDSSKTPNLAQDLWTRRALTEPLWKKGVPDFSVLWLSEPDYAQHGSGPGSPVAKAALESSDSHLQAVIDSLERQGVRKGTDIFVVSDHGFSTISRVVDTAAVLRDAGFNAKRVFEEPPGRGDVLVCGNGGSVLLYVGERDPDVTQRLVDFLQRSDFAGPIFTRERHEGTFPLSDARIRSVNDPDVLFSFRWTPEKNSAGLAGTIISDSRKPGDGMHGTLSRFDMHNTLIAQGPGFRSGVRLDTPSSNADLAPTILRLLGVEPPESMDGRVLSEALAGFEGEAPATSNRVLTAERTGKNFEWRQTLEITECGNGFYLNQGNVTASRKD